MNIEIENLLKDILEVDRLDSGRMRKLQNCKNLILLDMGCGSTSAAILELKKYRDSKDIVPTKYILPVTWEYGQLSIDFKRWISSSENVSIPTLIGYNDNLKPVVGTDALSTDASCENFKACPTKQNLDHVVLMVPSWDGVTFTPKRLRDIWSDYFKCVFEKICGWCSSQSDQGRLVGAPRNLTELAKGETVIMAAHPAGEEWSEPSVLQSYRELISEGTGVPDDSILTISEAKAAMQFVRRKKDGMYFGGGVMIIDIGASTMDIEYLKKELNNPVEYSFELAGRNADRLLAHYILETAYGSAMKAYPKPDQIPEEEFFTERDLPGQALFMYRVRVLKETISDRARGAVQDTSKVSYFPLEGQESVQISGDTLRGLLGEKKDNPYTGAVFGDRNTSIAYELPLLDYVCRQDAERRDKQYKRHAVQVVENTWYGHLEDMVRFVIDDLKKAGHSVSQVIVTGGSCRLLGLRDHIERAVKSSAGSWVSIHYMDTEQDYENSVPYGGGYYVSGILSRMDELVKFPDKLYQTLFEELKTAAANRIAARVDNLVQGLTIDSLRWWTERQEGSKECSVNALNEEIQRRCRECFQDSNRLNFAVESAVKDITLDSLPQTKAEITALLDALAQAKFTGNVRTETLKIVLPARTALNAVRTVDPNSLVGIGQSLSGLMQDVGNLLLNIVDDIFTIGVGYIDEDDIPRKKKYRQAAYNAYEKNKPSAVAGTLWNSTANALAEEFRKSRICGIPDQIIRNLRNDIMCALYLNE